MTLEHKSGQFQDGCKTPDPEWSTFSGVVSRESARISLNYVAIKDLPVYACDIQNAYLQASPSEKYYVVFGLEFGLDNTGKLAKKGSISTWR